MSDMIRMLKQSGARRQPANNAPDHAQAPQHQAPPPPIDSQDPDREFAPFPRTNYDQLHDLFLRQGHEYYHRRLPNAPPESPPPPDSPYYEEFMKYRKGYGEA